MVFSGFAQDTYNGECYNEQCLSIKSGCYNEHRCYTERGGILFTMESLIIVFTRERLFMLFMCIRLFMLFKFTCIILFLHLHFLSFIIFFLFKWLCWKVTLL